MKSVEAIKTLHVWDRQDAYVFDTTALSLLFNETGERLRATIKRLLSEEILRRAARGVFVYSLSNHIGPNTKYDIAKALRRGYYVYESFESACSQWGYISQIPIDCVTLATTGPSGLFTTPYGTIEFTHVHRSALEIVDGAIDRRPYEPVRIASRKTALEDMMSSKGRCIELIDWEMVEDDGLQRYV